MCVCLHIMSFGELLRKYICNFRLRLSSSLNSAIDNIYMSIVPLCCSHCIVFEMLQLLLSVNIYLVSQHSTGVPLDRQHTTQEMALHTVCF